MLIIFGLRVFYRTIAQGTFHCRRCGGDRPYRHRVGRRWFTLFFLPVIPPPPPHPPSMSVSTSSA